MWLDVFPGSWRSFKYDLIVVFTDILVVLRVAASDRIVFSAASPPVRISSCEFRAGVGGENDQIKQHLPVSTAFCPGRRVVRA